MMQTHNVSNRIRNHAALFIITKQALQDGVAPGVEICNLVTINHDNDNDDDNSGASPDGSQWEKLPSFILLVLDLQERTFAHESLVRCLEDSLFGIRLFAALFVFSVLALNEVVAPIFLLKADLSTDKQPIPCRAHQIILLTSSTGCL